MIASDLYEKYARPGPGYTIYPAKRFWNNDLDYDQWHNHIGQKILEDKFDLYVHIPFCPSLCTFCGLNIKVTKKREHISKYLQTILKEMDRYPLHSRFCETLIIGGGTPNYLSALELEDFLKEIQRKSHFKSLFIEVSPALMTSDHHKVLQKYNVSQIRIGIEDCDQLILKNVNREQNYQQVVQCSQEAKRYCQIVEGELIYGLPLQNLETHTRNLENSLKLQLDSYLIYQYRKVPWLGQSQKDIGLFELPNDEIVKEMKFRTLQIMNSSNYHYQSFENFVSQDILKLPMNRTIMGNLVNAQETLVGVGVSSISKSKLGLVQNSRVIDKYMHFIDSNRPAIEKSHFKSQSDVDSEELIQGILSDLQIPNLNIEPEMITDGLVVRTDNKLKITNLGRVFLKEICMNFDQYLN